MARIVSFHFDPGNLQKASLKGANPKRQTSNVLELLGAARHMTITNLGELSVMDISSDDNQSTSRSFVENALAGSTASAYPVRVTLLPFPQSRRS